MAPKLSLIMASSLIILTCTHLTLTLAESGGAMGGSSFSSGSLGGSSYHSTYIYSPSSSGSGGDLGDWRIIAYIVLGLIGICIIASVVSCMRDKGDRVLMLQIGLSGEARSIQRELSGIALTSNTSTVYGFHSILKRTTASLLRHPNYCVSGYSSVDRVKTAVDMEERFNKLSSQEREKFDIETLVNVDNVTLQRSYVPKENKLGKDYIVVTIVVAACGRHDLPVIKDRESLKVALQCLSSLLYTDIKAVHVLWTPQNENDSLVEEELLANYPLLKPISESLKDLSVQKGANGPFEELHQFQK